MEDSFSHELETGTHAVPVRGHTLEADSILRPVGELMRTNVGAVSPRDKISDAVQQMVRGHYGAVLVVEEGRLLGILSERDLLCKVTYRGLNPQLERVATHMTRNPETLRPEDALAYALNIMTVGGFRHVPIVDDEHIVQGIVSIRDIQRFLVSHFREEILTLPPRPVRAGPSDRYGG